MSSIIIWHSFANFHAFCSPTVPTRGNTFQSLCIARTFRVQSAWAFRLDFAVASDNVQNVTCCRKFICHNWDISIVRCFQPQYSGFTTSEFKLFHSWSWRCTLKEWKWAALFVGASASGLILVDFAAIFIYLLYCRSIRSSHVFPP